MRQKLMRIVMLSSALSALALATASPALASTETPLVTVSSTDPYTGCANDGQTGTVTKDAEVEPQVAVNPHTAGNIIGAWQQDRWSNGGAHGLLAGFSTDGGKTWGESQLPFSGCVTGSNPVLDPFTGTPYNRASDPWVSIGPDGTAYAVALAATESTVSGGGNNDTGVAAATSTDGGKSWGNARLVKSDQGTSPVFEFTHFFNDKESVTADPIHAGTAYVVWDRLTAPSHSPDAALRAHAFRGPAWFSKTTDGGKTWTGTRAIFDPGQNSQTIGNVIVVNPRTGALYDFFEQFQTTGSPKFTPRGFSVGFVSSPDGGTTWSGPTTVAAQQFVTDTDPNTRDGHRPEHRRSPSHRRGPALGRHRPEHRTALRGLVRRSIHRRNHQPDRHLHLHRRRKGLDRAGRDQQGNRQARLHAHGGRQLGRRRRRHLLRPPQPPCRRHHDTAG